MEDLPKLTDSIYKEIEEFEDYEYSNCIAYEMCIRNKEVKSLLNDVEIIRKNYFKVAKMYAETKTEKCNLKTKEDVVNIIKDSIDDFMMFRRNVIIDKLSEIYNKFGLALFDINSKEESILENLKNTHFKTKGSFNNILTFKEENNNEKCEILSSTYNDKLDLPKVISKIEYVNNKCNIVTSRPRIEVNNSPMIDIKLNLNLPKNELIAYISKTKDEYDKNNSIVKTPLGLLLGEDIKIDNSIDKNKINKNLIAKKFFVYDYVTKRLEQIEDSIKNYTIEYEEKKENIKKNPYYTRQDKLIQLKDLKKELEENINQRKIEILEEFEDIPKGTAKRYYYDIKPFIDDLKYKELI